MVKMTAAVRCKSTGERLTITSDYATKRDFRADLNRNGYAVIGRISTEGDKSRKQQRYDRGCKK